jgi:S1-C subfamily serine protease
MATRRAHERRRARRLRIGASVLGGAVIVCGLVWVTRVGPADTDLVADEVRRGTADVGASPATSVTTGTTPSTTTTVVLALTTPADDPTRLVVRTTEGEPLAGAVLVRDGYVATSGAALAGATDVTVTWGDTTAPGVVVGHDHDTDISVIRVDGATPTSDHTDAPVTTGDTVRLPSDDGTHDDLEVVAAPSASALANGEPLVGIVELDRRLGDVPPGSPAFDDEGDIVGITTATASSAPAALVPIDLAREVADDIIDTGEASHPRLGVVARDPDGALPAGSLITAVDPDGPASAAGVLEGDVLVRIDDHDIDSMAAMVATLRSYEPGEVIALTLWRSDGEFGCLVALASSLDADV